MTSLEILQREFANALNHQDNQATAHLKGHRFSPDALLQVYQNNFVISLTETLAAVYPVCQQVVGEAFFAQAARRFILNQPLAKGDVTDYGDGFATHLGQLAASYDLPYLTDLATLEWRYQLSSHHAGYEEPFPFARLAALNEGQQPRLVLELNRSHWRLSSPFPVFSIYRMVVDGCAEQIAIDQPESGVIWRCGPTETRLMQLSPQESALMQRLTERQPLGELLGSAASSPMETIQHWIELKLISSFSLEDEHQGAAT